MPLKNSRSLIASFLIAALEVSIGGNLSAQSPADCPGVIINEIPAPSQIFGNPISPRYVSDPCILVLSNGDYLAAHALFGSASGAGTSGRTSIFRSSDQGTTWTKVNGGNDLNGILRGSLFELDGAVYLLGANNDAAGNVAVISRSTNNGDSWTPPTSLAPLVGMATPDNALTANGRLWLATTTATVSCATTTDPMLAASWSRPGGFPAASGTWLPGTGFDTTDNFIGEGQISHSPDEGLVILPKVRLLSYSALARVNPVNGRVSFDPDRDFVPLPGAEKKFGVRYDPVSGKYFMLSNPILPADAGSPIARDLIRNTAAVFSSRDLRNWKLEKIFLHTANINYEGFQYFNFEFAGNDIVLVSRTGFDVGGNKPPRGHDSNLLTFHRIPDFRNLTRDLYLRIEGGEVRRYERTQHADAPLGVFARGSSFDGQPLTNPNAMGVDGNSVYIREFGGRVLHFDLAGNFLGTVDFSPVLLESANLTIPSSADGEGTWNLAGSGAWSDPQSWQDWKVPGTASDVATFGSAVSGPATVTLDISRVAWNFDQAGNFEGWVPTNVDTPAVLGGVLRGTVQANNDPFISRLDLNFRGDAATHVRIRIRVNTTSTVPVDLFWGNSSDDTFSGTRRVRVNYTGTGNFQELTFSMAARSGWAGEQITRLRIDPTNGAFTGNSFEVDAIVIPMASDATTLAGLRFLGPENYTLSGSGQLRLTGTPRLTATQGHHLVSLPVEFAANSVASIATDASLTLAGMLSGNQSITKEGGGTLTLTGANSRTGPTTVSDGTLAISSAQLDGNLFLTTGGSLQLNFPGTDSIDELWLDGVQKWKGTWGHVGSGASYETTAISGTGFLSVTVGPDPGYDGWAWQNGLTGQPGFENGPTDNPDQDNLPNLFEWILGGAPLTPDQPSLTPQVTKSGPNFIFTFSRDDTSEAVAPCIVQYGTDLETWIDVPVGASNSGPDAAGVTVEVTENGELPDTIIVSLPSTIAPQRRLFLRLKSPSH